MSPRFKRWAFWLLVIVGLVILFRVLTYLIHLTFTLVLILIAVVLIWILYQAGKNRWL